MNFDLPLLNACLNGLSSVFLILGWRAIKKEQIQKHKTLMITAFVTSTIFLASYLFYHFTQGHFKFTGEGLKKTIYLLILGPHIILAMAMVPMIILCFVFAFRGQLITHRKLARITLPIWLYVSVTGVVLYLYIYVLFPGNIKKEKDVSQLPNKELLQ
jgi:putative membrane protein